MKKWILYLLSILMFATLSQSETKEKKKNKLEKATVAWAQRIKQGFRMRVWLSNDMKMGLRAWDNDASGVPDGFGLEYPVNSGVEHLYGGGPRIGGRLDGRILVTEGYNGYDASTEMIPEYKHLPREHFWRTSVGASQRAIDNNTPDPLGFSGYYFIHKITVDSLGCDNDKDGKINEDPLDGEDNDGDWNPATDDIGADGIPDEEEVDCNGKPYDPITNPDPAYDNYDPAQTNRCSPDGTNPPKADPDIYTEKNGIPDHGEPHVDEDYGAVSESDLYCSATDTFSTPKISSHIPMHVKVIQKSYAWDNPYAQAILPFDYIFINMNRTKTIEDVYVGYFADIDLGPVNVNQYYQNNYAAYFDTLRTGYIHNAIDRGSTPLGVTVLSTPIALDSLDYIWQWSDFSTRPDPGTNDSVIYSWMNGSAFPNQKIAPNQSPTNPSDTRFLFSFGKFTLKPLDSLKISIALVSGQTISEGPDNLKENAERAIELHRRGYVTPITLDSPRLDYEIKDNTVKLTWFPHVTAGSGLNSGGPYSVWDDSNHYVENNYPPTHWRRINPPCDSSSGCSSIGKHKCVNGYLPGGRTFTGFRLYRSEFRTDRVGLDGAPGEEKYTLLREYTLPDTATLWSISHLDSTFVDSFLVRGKTYWYVVTAFGLPNVTVLPVISPDGSIRYDTLRSPASQSSFTKNVVRIDLPFDVSREPKKVLVVPNPYRVDQDYTYENGGWEGYSQSWDETKRMVKFIHLPEDYWTLRIFTLTGEEIITIKNTPESGFMVGDKSVDVYKPNRGEINWNLTSASRRALASGVYVYSVESKLGTQIDKFVLIR